MPPNEDALHKAVTHHTAIVAAGANPNGIDAKIEVGTPHVEMAPPGEKAPAAPAPVRATAEIAAKAIELAQAASERRTLRVMLAGQAITGLVHHSGFSVSPEKVAQHAQLIADATLAQLERTK